ncbi:MAG: glycosyltransferase family 4 protein [Rhodobacterales bacterium]|nr:glycosyltransferase family 4 protein [Rhodobacterales bacterium]MDX5412729.1 glycosyltransferase family 4 protein [Rhodobacterales bacterium]
MSRPKIVLIGGDGGYSGVPRYLLQMVKALRDRADITVVSDVNEGGFDALRGSGARHLTVHGLKTSGSPARGLRALLALRAILGSGRPDLIWAHSRMAVLLLRLLLLRPGFGGQYAVTHHSLPFERGYPQPYATLLRWWEAVMIRIVAPHHILFLTETARRHYCAAMPASALRRHSLHVLNNCSDLGPWPVMERLDAAARVLVMTGRDSHQKNLRAALQLFAHLPENYRLVLCGAGTDQPAFQAALDRILDREQQARVDLRGPLPDVRPVLATAAGYLLTSRYEGVPIGAIEAWEAGLPLALSRIDGTADILQRHPLALPLDLTVPWQDLAVQARALDEMISRYLSDQTGWRAAIQRAWAEQHSHAAWSEQLRAVLSLMLKKGPGCGD